MELTKKQFDGFILFEEDAQFYINDTSKFLSDENVKKLVRTAKGFVPLENMLRETDTPPSIEEITLMINKMMFMMGMNHAFKLVMEDQKEWAKKQKIKL